MTIEQIRSKIAASTWKAITQSNVDLSGVALEDKEKLVAAITTQMLATFNSLLDEVPEQAAAVETPVEVEGEEQILWKGRPFLSLTESYVVTSERIKIITGFLSRAVENFELIRIQDIDLSQGVSERILGIGDIQISGQDSTHTKIILRNISKPEEVYEILRKAWLASRKRHNLQFREYM